MVMPARARARRTGHSPSMIKRHSGHIHHGLHQINPQPHQGHQSSIGRGESHGRVLLRSIDATNERKPQHLPIMSSFNKVILLGHLTRDPELRYTPKGTAVAKIGLAVNRNWTTESGEKKEEVTFVDIDVFGRVAENCGQYLKKGRPVLIEGRLKLDQWDDKQTRQRKSKLGVVGETVQFLGSSDKGTAPAAAKASPAAEPLAEDGPPESDDVPF